MLIGSQRFPATVESNGYHRERQLARSARADESWQSRDLLSLSIASAPRRALSRALPPIRCNKCLWRTGTCCESKFAETRPMSKVASLQPAPIGFFSCAMELTANLRRNTRMGRKAQNWQRCLTSPTDGHRRVSTGLAPNGNGRRNWTTAAGSLPVSRQSMPASH